MGKTTVLLTPLNPVNPAPNAASIMAHSPGFVLFLRFPGINKAVERDLDDVEGRIRSWCLGELKERYGLEEDLQLSHEPMGPQNIPQIEVLRVKGFLESAQEIASQIHELSKNLGDIEIRIDVNCGRKEDVANLVKHASEVLEDVDFTIWYTDVGTGHSVEIGSGIETRRPPIDPLTRIWLGGFPIIFIDSEIDVNSARGRVLSAYLDSVENALGEEGEEGQLLVEEYLTKEDISISRECFLKDKKDNTISKFTVPEDILDPDSGFWLEKLSGLAIAEAWDFDTVYVGVGIGSNTKKARIKNGIAKLRWAHYKDERRGLVDLLGPYQIPDEFPNIIKDGNQFVKWIAQEYDNLPPSFRNGFLEHSKKRDLDVFAQNQKEAFFIECKLSRGSTEDLQDANKSQLNSLLLSISSHRYQFSMLIDKAGREVSRTPGNNFVAPWYLLRRRDDLEQSGIGKGVAAARQGIWIPPDWTESEKKREDLRRRDEEKSEEIGRRSDSLKKARDQTQPEMKYYCPVCIQLFEKWSHTFRHKQETGHGAYKCDDCQTILISEKRLEIHKEETGHTEISGDFFKQTEMRTKKKADLGDTVVMLKDKCGMSRGASAQIVGTNRTQWKLSNGKAVQHDQHTEAWVVVASEEE